MSIIIKDETANAVVLTIDNLGNMSFADGTPVSLLSLNGQQVIDDNGFIVHGLTGCSPAPSTGSVAVGVGQSAIVTTLIGRTPIAQIDTAYPAQAYVQSIHTGVISSTPLYGEPVCSCEAGSGQFQIANNNSADPSIQNITPVASVRYKWL
jgi:hypothetical protein